MGKQTMSDYSKEHENAFSLQIQIEKFPFLPAVLERARSEKLCNLTVLMVLEEHCFTYSTH